MELTDNLIIKIIANGLTKVLTNVKFHKFVKEIKITY